MNLMRLSLWLTVFAVALASHVARADGPITLASLIHAAIKDDPWLVRSELSEQANRKDAIAAGGLPDPKLSASFANLPTDSLSFSQEPMTQVNIGVSQAFPGGNTRSLRRERLELMGDGNGIERVVRRAQIERQLTAVWLEASLAARTATLIDDDRALFEQLLEATRASYRSAAGRVNQQDLIRAQLEISRLDERVLRLEEVRERALMKLSEWVPTALLAGQFDWVLPALAEIPDTPLIERDARLLQHPEIVQIDQQLRVARTERDLIAASKKPGWSVNASYAYRDADFGGRDLPDFVSVGVSMDLPLFTKNRQDKRISAAADRTAAIESARLLKLRELKSRLANTRAANQRLRSQLMLYEDSLLGQLNALAQSAKDAYGSDRGDFADVMRAYIAGLNARIEVLRLETAINDERSKYQYLSTVYYPQGEIK